MYLNAVGCIKARTVVAPSLMHPSNPTVYLVGTLRSVSSVLPKGVSAGRSLGWGSIDSYGDSKIDGSH